MSSEINENAIEDAQIVSETRVKNNLYFFSFWATKGNESGFGSQVFNINDEEVSVKVLETIINDLINKNKLDTCAILNWKKVGE